MAHREPSTYKTGDALFQAGAKLFNRPLSILSKDHYRHQVTGVLSMVTGAAQQQELTDTERGQKVLDAILRPGTSSIDDPKNEEVLERFMRCVGYIWVAKGRDAVVSEISKAKFEDRINRYFEPRFGDGFLTSCVNKGSEPLETLLKPRPVELFQVLSDKVSKMMQRAGSADESVENQPHVLRERG